MKKAFMILGNFGVGKSAVIDYPIQETENIFLRIFDNNWIVGKTSAGADSLSSMLKKDVFKLIQDNPQKNLILAGVYYSQQIDIQRLSKTHQPVIIYLDTTYQNNAERIALRGKTINPATYLQKVNLHINLMLKTKHIAKIHIVDNNRPLEIVKAEVREIIKNETA